MKITYIHHSSFAVELDNCILLFDYFKGNLPDFDKNKKLYVFSSHSHHDHFNKSVFELEKSHPNVKYILSDDIQVPSNENINFIGANEKLSLDNLKIETLLSSDLGVAFIINVENKTIYHAGDLNWWHWEGENSIDDNDEAERMFKDSINKIDKRNIDLAFLPLDPRQGDYYHLGFDYFMNKTNTKIAIPMHLWGDYSLIETFRKSKYASDYKDEIVTISHEYEEFQF